MKLKITDPLGVIARVLTMVGLEKLGVDPETAVIGGEAITTLVGDLTQASITGLSKSEKEVITPVKGSLILLLKKLEIENYNDCAEEIVNKLFSDESLPKLIMSTDIESEIYHSIKSSLDYYYLTDNESNVEEVIRNISFSIEEVICKDEKLFRDYMYFTQKEMYELIQQISKSDKQTNIDQQSPTNKSINRKKEYIEKWNEPMFLHRTSHNRIALKDGFVMPTCSYNYRNGTDTESIVDVFINDSNLKWQKSMLIMGYPGMGKTSLCCSIADKYKNLDGLYVLKFSDIKMISNNSLLENIKSNLGNEWNQVKLLILDGFDEIVHKINEKYLETFLLDIRNYEIKVIITSRFNYINLRNINEKQTQVIQLEKFDHNKIKEFYSIICETNEEMPELNIDTEILGIPIILYLACSIPDINFNGLSSIAQLYEQIFSKNDSIWDRFPIQDKSGQDTGGYDPGKPHPVYQDIELVLTFLQEFALLSVEKNFKVTKKEFNELLVTFKQEHNINSKDEIFLDFRVRHLYDDNGGNIEFVHKTLADYFYARLIFNTIIEATTEDDVTILLKNLPIILNNEYGHKKVVEDYDFWYFLEYMLRKESSNTKKFIINAFNIMLKKGMVTETEKMDKNILRSEYNIFINLLNLVCLCEEIYISKIDNKLFGKYIRLLHIESLDLRKFELTNADFEYASLKKANLAGTNLRGANLSGADLRDANLGGAFLIVADLRGADLRDAELGRACLSGADLSSSDLGDANLRDAYLRVAHLEGAYLKGAHLEGAHLEGAYLEGAYLEGAYLKGAHLERADLRGAILIGADLAGANLTGTILDDLD